MLAGAMVEEQCETAKAVRVNVNLKPHVHNRVASKVPASAKQYRYFNQSTEKT
jgi:hypothetical protein